MSWIDFKALREKLDFSQVLAHYRVELKRKGDRASAFCPLPSHNGRRRSPSFSADLKRGLFQCFGCGAKGNVLDFACLLEQVDPRDSKAFFRVAAELEKQFLSPAPSGNGKSNGRAAKPRPRELPATRQPETVPAVEVLVNPPLDFELKTLDAKHPYLRNRGFTPETVKHFGLGFCNRGSLKHRIAIPLHDMAGNLIGYAGRVIDDSKISEENPKYRFPVDREREGKRLEFKKSVFLYNGSSIRKPVRDLLVVEGFPATWWLWQNGVENVVAVMGSSCSQEQGALITELIGPTGCVWVFTDGDDAGRRCAASIFLHVGPHRFTRLVRCEEGEQPTDWAPEELLGSFAGAETSDHSDEPIGATLGGEATGEAREPRAAG